MKRRETFKLIPLALAGAGILPVISQAIEKPDVFPGQPGPGPEPLSLTYTKNVMKMLRRVRENQSDTIFEAAYAIARTVKAGRKVWSCWDLGHTNEADLKNLNEFKKRGMRVASIGPVTRNNAIPDGRAVQKESEVHVGRLCDTYGLFAVPGFYQNVCPTSGILAISILWVMSTELAMILTLQKLLHNAKDFSDSRRRSCPRAGPRREHAMSLCGGCDCRLSACGSEGSEDKPHSLLSTSPVVHGVVENFLQMLAAMDRGLFPDGFREKFLIPLTRKVSHPDITSKIAALVAGR